MYEGAKHAEAEPSMPSKQSIVSKQSMAWCVPDSARQHGGWNRVSDGERTESKVDARSCRVLKTMGRVSFLSFS